MTHHPIEKYRTGRNYVRTGDLVKCSPTTRERSFVGRVVRIDADDETGAIVAVNVSTVCTCSGKRHPDVGKSRAFTPDRIARTLTRPIEELEEVGS